MFRMNLCQASLPGPAVIDGANRAAAPCPLPGPSPLATVMGSKTSWDPVQVCI